jgi:hypothetical protein
LQCRCHGLNDCGEVQIYEFSRLLISLNIHYSEILLFVKDYYQYDRRLSFWSH